MFDIPFYINLFMSLIELEHSLKTSSKRADILYLFISLIEVKHPLKTSNKRIDIALHVYFFN